MTLAAEMPVRAVADLVGEHDTRICRVVHFHIERALSALVHHSDRGGQYLAIRYSERLAQAGAVASVGSKGDSYDNALAETVNGLFKTELIRRAGPWRTVEDVELATLRWVHWWNERRLHSACGDVPPAEFEARYYAQQSAIPAA